MSFNCLDTPSIARCAISRIAVAAVVIALASCAPRQDPTDSAVSCAADAQLPIVSVSPATDGIAIDPAGKITLVRMRDGLLTVDRYLPDGKRCTDGDPDEEVAIDSPMQTDAVAIGPSGELIVLNDGGDAVFTLSRYLVDGTLDTSFGDNGFVAGSFDDPRLRLRSAAAAVAIQTDGSILVAGTWGDSVGPHEGMVPIDPESKLFAVARHRADGTADPTFADGGFFTASVAPGQDAAFGMSVAGDGSIVLVGESGRLTPGPFDNDVAVLVLDHSGRPRKSFGSDGATHAHVRDTTVNSGRAAARTPDGAVVVIPWIDGSPSATIGRFNRDGTVDALFGRDGFVDFPSLRSFVGMAVQADGRIVVSTIDGRLVRINENGTIDDSFGLDGVTDLP